MKRASLLVVALIVICTSWFAERLVSQDKAGRKPSPQRDTPSGEDRAASEKAQTQAELDMQAVMKKWKEIREPGRHHTALEPLIGRWKYKQKIWVQPGSPPDETTGSTEVRWVMGKRFVQVESTGKMFDLPYNSMWLIGFDNFKKKYVSCYLDNVGTGIYPAEGSAGPGKNAITLIGHMDDWYTAEHDRAFAYVIRLGEKDQWSLEMTDLASGAKAMEIVYSRARE